MFGRVIARQESQDVSQWLRRSESNQAEPTNRSPEAETWQQSLVSPIRQLPSQAKQLEGFHKATTKLCVWDKNEGDCRKGKWLLACPWQAKCLEASAGCWDRFYFSLNMLFLLVLITLKHLRSEHPHMMFLISVETGTAILLTERLEKTRSRWNARKHFGEMSDSPAAKAIKPPL